MCCTAVHRRRISGFPHWRSLVPIRRAYDGFTQLDRGLDILLSRPAGPLGSPSRRARPSRRTGFRSSGSHLVSTFGRRRW